MEEELQQQESEVMSKYQLYFELPLYEPIERSLIEERFTTGDVDAYNPESGFDTTYKVESSKIGDGNSWSDYNNFYRITLTCKRNDKDKLRFFLYIGKDVVMKVGQLPSLADIQFAEIGKKYDQLLSREDLKEFKRAIGLAAHGVGAGSFIYLRRIFENLITETFKANQKSTGINQEGFLVMRIEDKIDKLKAFLPSQLLEMKSIYKVLSKGVHELSEQECLKYFPPMKLSIELILEQRIEMEIKRERDAAVKKQIQDINQELTI